MERLALEAGLQLVDLGELAREPVLPERGARLMGQGLEQPEVVATEGGAHPEPVGDQQRADPPALARQPRDHRALHSEPAQVASEGLAHVIGRDQPSRGIALDELAQLAHDRRVERLNPLGPVGDADDHA